MRSSQIAPRELSNAATVSGKIHRVVSCGTAEIDGSENCGCGSRLEVQFSTYGRVQLYRRLERPPGLLVRMGRAKHKMHK